MYVCLCKGVSDKKLLSVGKKAKTVKELMKRTKAGTCCGICIPELSKFISKKGEENDSVTGSDSNGSDSVRS